MRHGINPNSIAFTVLLGFYAALPALSIDVSAPTLVLLPKALDTSKTIAGLTLSLFMVGFAVGQLVGGRASDRHGRRPVLLSGLALYTAAGLAGAAAQSGLGLVLSRLFQGIGAGSCSVLAFAIVQDLFQGDSARAKRSYVTVVFGAAPIVAPALGSLLVDWDGWRFVYVAMAVAGAALLLVSMVSVPESHDATRTLPSVSEPPPNSRLSSDGRFIGIAAANALSYGGVFAYVAGSPVIIMGQLGLSARMFAGIFASTAVALTAGAWSSGRLSRRGFGAIALLDPSLVVAAAATVALAYLSMRTSLSPGIMIVPVIAFLFSRGIIAPNLQHLAIDRQRRRAGAASAAIGVSQLLAGALVSAIVAALLPWMGAGAVALPMACTAVAAMLCWILAAREPQNP